MAALGASVALAACSGGGGSSGPAATAQSTSVVSYGAITGFGSVYVNGTRYDVSKAMVTDAGQSVAVSDLQVGQTVRVEAQDSHDGGLPEALHIDRDAALQGAIASIDTTAGTMVVLGQTVAVGSDTLFAKSIQPASLGGLTVGQSVEVDGFVGADGTVHATRIEPADATAALKVTGKIAGLDSTAKTFEINALTVLYDQATLAGFAAAGPADGDVVEVEGASVNGSGQLVADRVMVRRFDDKVAEDANHVEVEGLVTRFASLTDFDVNDQTVTTNSDTQFIGGASADLALNVKVEVEGSFDANHVLVATKVNLRQEANVALDGNIDAIDTAAGTLQMLGITVSVNTNTGFDDRSAEDDRYIALGKLAVGDHVEIRGTATGANAVQATRLERESGTAATVRLRGPVASVAEPDFSIVGTTIATTPSTRFEHGTSADLFGTTAPTYASVSGTWDGTTLTAGSVAIETGAAMHD